MNVGSFREVLWTGGKGLVEVAEVLSRRVVYVPGCDGGCLHVV